MSQPPARPCLLVIVTGTTPQVLTETVWSLVRQHSPSYRPETIHVLTTSVGDAVLKAHLLGISTRHPVQGVALPAHDRWTAFCRDVLDGHRPLLKLHVPTRTDGHPLPDIRNVDDDAAFMDRCYRVVAEAMSQPMPVVGSLAGGRKTMSAHLMTAFSLFARPKDQLVHILVSPPEREHQPDFFYPVSGSPEFVRIDRVHVRFPRLRRMLAEKGLPQPSAVNVAPVFRMLEPVAEDPPARVRCVLRPRSAGGCELHLSDDDGVPQAVCPVSPGQAATFLVVAEAFRIRSGPVPNTDLVEQPTVEAQRRAVLSAAAVYHAPVPWNDTTDVSKSVSAFNRRLRDVPPARHFLTIHGTPTREATYYTWPTALPRVDVACPPPAMDLPWPFEAIPRRPA